MINQIKFWSDIGTERNVRNLSWSTVERETGVHDLAKRWQARATLSEEEIQKLAGWAGYDLAQYEEVRS